MATSLLIISLTIMGVCQYQVGASRLDAISIESSIIPSADAEVLNYNLRFFGFTKTIAVTTTIRHTQVVYVHPTCTFVLPDIFPCLQYPPTTTTTAAPVMTTPQPVTTEEPETITELVTIPDILTTEEPHPTIHPIVPVLLSSPDSNNLLSAFITISKPELPHIQINLPNRPHLPQVAFNGGASLGVTATTQARRHTDSLVQQYIEPSTVSG